jgi:DNA-binding winged helix-turn-helix (wHTH) protein/predicted ATPase
LVLTPERLQTAGSEDEDWNWMDSANAIVFGPFRLELSENRLRRGKQTMELQPRPLALLRYLATNPGRIVGKDELLKAVWSGTVVSRTTLKVCVRTVRKVLREDTSHPRYIETVGREGYRFIGSPAAGSSTGPQGDTNRSPRVELLGRERETELLRAWMEAAQGGSRCLVFVAGEAGIGKTTLVERFLNGIRTEESVYVARGQCLERSGEGEPYLPFLDAVAALCRERDGERALRLLQRYAPTWLLQLPALLDDAERETLQRQVGTATRERMLREMADALDAFAAERTLVLVFEDLHWSDVSTLELLAYLAQRREPARLLLIGTYRPTDVIVREHRLRGIRQELKGRGLCQELELELLTPATVAEYIRRRLGEGTVSAELARVVHRRTQGNALFMVEMLDHLADRGLIAESEGQWRLEGTIEEAEQLVPDNLRQLIEKQVERLLPHEQRLLEAASIAGVEFSVAALAAGLRRDMEEIEESCEALAWKGSFLCESGIIDWPDGTVSGRYRFAHVLYRNVLYDRIAEARRVRLHRLIGEREETGYGNRSAEIATGLAEHFERSREYARAARYRLAAADNAVRRCAHDEATRHFTRGLDLLAFLPQTSERAHEELLLCFRLGTSLSYTKGFAAPEVERAFVRAQDLCRQLGDSHETLLVLPALRGFHFVRGDLPNAEKLAQRLLRIAERVQDPFLLLWAHFGLGENLLHAGSLTAARVHFQQALQRADPRAFGRTGAFRGIQDPAIASRSCLALTLWLLGFPDQALREQREALAAADGSSDPATLVFAQTVAALHHSLRRQSHATRTHAETAIAVAVEHGFPYWRAWATILRGWAVADGGSLAEGTEELRQGLADYEATGAAIARPWCFALLAAVQRQAGDVGGALSSLEAALMSVETGQARTWEAELHRLTGELRLEQRAPANSDRRGKRSEQDSNAEEAQKHFLRALEIARSQEAKLWELRAVTSLNHSRTAPLQRGKARQMLAETYAWFTEGFETADLQAAKALLSTGTARSHQ